MKDTPGKPTPVTGANLDEKIKNAKTRLDAQVREIVRWHFSPDTGTPFWLEKAKSFNFNPLHRDLNRGDHRLVWNAIPNWQAIVAEQP